MRFQFEVAAAGPVWRWSILCGPGEGRTGWALTKAGAKRAAWKLDDGRELRR